MPLPAWVAPAAFGAATGLLGGLVGRDANRKAMGKQLEAQREFAQHGIQWRVEDAKAAGVHPLYALGASTSGPTLSVMDDPLGSSLSGMGQDVTRAAMASASKPDRAIGDLQLEIARSNRDKAAYEAAEARMNAFKAARGPSQLGPGFPSPDFEAIPGQGDTSGLVGAFEAKPNPITSRDYRNPSWTAMDNPFWDWQEESPGNYFPVMRGSQASEMFENPIAALWALNVAHGRNPNFFRNSTLPYGVAINEFLDWRDNFSRDVGDLIDAIKAEPARLDKVRRWREMEGRGDPGTTYHRRTGKRSFYF